MNRFLLGKVTGTINGLVTSTIEASSPVTITKTTDNQDSKVGTLTVSVSTATTETAGLMSAADKSKLNGVAEGATANTGTITGITMNGASKGTSGVVDLGTVITAHQDISGKIDKSIGTAKGDLLYYSAANTPVRLGIGSNGQVLKVNSNGIPAWAEDNNTTYTAASTAPLMDGTAAVGTSTDYARADHVHPTDTSRASASDLQTLQTENTKLKNLLSRMEIECNASGNPIIITDAKASSIKDVVVNIESIQSGSGVPSPSNVRPITGVSSVTITRGGKNFLTYPYSSIPATMTENGVTVTDLGNGELMLNGATQETAAYYVMKRIVPIDGTYIASGVSGNVDLRVWAAGTAAGGSGTYHLVAHCQGAESQTFQFSAAEHGALDVELLVDTNKTVSNVTISPMIRPVSESATFEPYQGQTVTAQLVDSNNDPLTVYGGTLDVTTGLLTVTHMSFTLTGTTSVYRYTNWDSSTHYGYYTGWFDSIKSYSTSQCLSDKASFGYPGSEALYIFISGGNGRCEIRIRKDLLSEGTNEAIWAWFAENPVQLVAPLETPVTYQLTPQSLSTLSGYNTICSSAGNSNIVYKADPLISLQ